MAGVIKPLGVTDAMLISSTAAEPGAGETTWTSGATFGLGQRAVLGSPAATVTISIASPAVITLANNGLPNDTPVVLTTTGALPTGLVAGTIALFVEHYRAPSPDSADSP